MELALWIDFWGICVCILSIISIEWATSIASFQFFLPSLSNERKVTCDSRNSSCRASSCHVHVNPEFCSHTEWEKCCHTKQKWNNEDASSDGSFFGGVLFTCHRAQHRWIRRYCYRICQDTPQFLADTGCYCETGKVFFLGVSASLGTAMNSGGNKKRRKSCLPHARRFIHALIGLYSCW